MSYFSGLNAFKGFIGPVAPRFLSRLRIKMPVTSHPASLDTELVGYSFTQV